MRDSRDSSLRVDGIAKFTTKPEWGRRSAVEMEDKYLRAILYAHVRDNPNDPELRAKAAFVLYQRYI